MDTQRIWSMVAAALVMGGIRVGLEYYREWKGKRPVRLVPDGRGGFRPSQRIRKFELFVKWSIAACYVFVIVAGLWAVGEISKTPLPTDYSTNHP